MKSEEISDSRLREIADFYASLPLGTAEEERARVNTWVLASLSMLQRFANLAPRAERESLLNNIHAEIVKRGS